MSIRALLIKSFNNILQLLIISINVTGLPLRSGDYGPHGPLRKGNGFKPHLRQVRSHNLAFSA